MSIVTAQQRQRIWQVCSIWVSTFCFLGAVFQVADGRTGTVGIALAFGLTAIAVVALLVAAWKSGPIRGGDEIC